MISYNIIYNLNFRNALYIVMGLHTRGNTNVGQPEAYDIMYIYNVSISLLSNHVILYIYYIRHLSLDSQIWDDQDVVAYGLITKFSISK